MEKLAISSSGAETHENPTEAVEVVNILKEASSILGVHGSGISFFTGDNDGMVRCDVCFALHCEKDPGLASKDPFFLSHQTHYFL